MARVTDQPSPDGPTGHPLWACPDCGTRAVADPAELAAQLRGRLYAALVDEPVIRRDPITTRWRTPDAPEAERIAATLAAALTGRLGAVPEGSGDLVGGPWLIPGECIADDCPLVAVRHRHRADTTPEPAVADDVPRLAPLAAEIDGTAETGIPDGGSYRATLHRWAATIRGDNGTGERYVACRALVRPDRGDLPLTSPDDLACGNPVRWQGDDCGGEDRHVDELDADDFAALRDPALAVGDPVETPEQLATLGEGAVVRAVGGMRVRYERLHDGHWYCTGDTRRKPPDLVLRYGARVAELPDPQTGVPA